MILFFSLLASSLILFLGFLVYFHDTASVSNRIFFIHTAVISIWSMLNYVSLIVDPAKALLWIRLVLFLAVPHVFLFFLFVLNFPARTLKISKRSLAYLLGWMFLVMGLCLTPLVFSGANVVDVRAVPVPGLLMPYFAAVLVIVSVITFALILKRFFQSAGIEKRQWSAISLGLTIAYTLLICLIFLAVVLFKITYYVQYSSLFVLPIFLGAAYAIIRFRFLNVKVIATEILGFLLFFVNIWQVLLAKNLAAIIFQSIATALVLAISIFLVRSVLSEVRQRELLQKLSEQLESANKQLKILDQAKTEFLSVASHQLRTPLTAIKGYVSMLLDGDYGFVPQDQRQILKTVFDSSERLAALIADLLDLSRIESGKMEFDFAAVNLCAIVESVVAELSARAKQKGLYLYFDNVNRSCPNIRADSDKIRQVIINLIDNAIKYTVSGGVTVRLIRRAEELQFSVADTGIGIAAGDQQKLFDKFFRADAAAQLTKEGSGLGIYVVKKIVQAHGGKIWFESSGAGSGATFYVSLPIPSRQIQNERVSIRSLEAL